MSFSRAKHTAVFGILLGIVLLYPDLVARIVSVIAFIHILWHKIAEET